MAAPDDPPPTADDAAPPGRGPGDPAPATAGIGLVVLALVAAAGGIVIGLIGSLFRWGLDVAADWRSSLVDRAHDWPAVGWLVPVVVVAVCAGAARAIVRLVPLASGSGIPDVEAGWRGERPPPPWTVLPATLVGGLLAIGSGLALGREGPTVHMGAVVGSVAGRWTRVSPDDRRVLQAALAGAGLGVAFNAPLGGALFTVEEVTRTTHRRVVVATLASSAVAVATMRAVRGDAAEFVVPAITAPPLWAIAVFVVFGALTGALGVAYDKAILLALRANDRAARWPAETRASAIGAVVGLLLWFDPLVVGGDYPLAQRLLDGSFSMLSLVGIGYLVARFVLGPLSYSAGAPGGLFAPLLVLGGLWGALAQAVLEPLTTAFGTNPALFAIVGMAALFAGSVRAPLTGVVLIAEMTATTTTIVPMLAAAAAAMVVAAVLRQAPIYESLATRDAVAAPPGP